MDARDLASALLNVLGQHPAFEDTDLDVTTLEGVPTLTVGPPDGPVFRLPVIEEDRAK